MATGIIEQIGALGEMATFGEPIIGDIALLVGGRFRPPNRLGRNLICACLLCSMYALLARRRQLRAPVPAESERFAAEVAQGLYSMGRADERRLWTMAERAPWAGPWTATGQLPDDQLS